MYRSEKSPVRRWFLFAPTPSHGYIFHTLQEDKNLMFGLGVCFPSCYTICAWDLLLCEGCWEHSHLLCFLEIIWQARSAIITVLCCLHEKLICYILLLGLKCINEKQEQYGTEILVGGWMVSLWEPWGSCAAELFKTAEEITVFGSSMDALLEEDAGF